MLESLLVALPGLVIAAVFLIGETYVRIFDAPRFSAATTRTERRQ